MRDAIRQYVATPRQTTFVAGAFGGGGGGQYSTDELLKRFAVVLAELSRPQGNRLGVNFGKGELGGGLGWSTILSMLKRSRHSIRGSTNFIRDLAWSWPPFNRAKTECGFWAWIIVVLMAVVLLTIGVWALLGYGLPNIAATPSGS